MRKCLQNSKLLLLLEGEATSAERAHLEACETCSGRYRRLVRDLGVIDRVLREEPPRRPLIADSRSLRARWVPVVAALALLLVSVWGIMRVEKQSSPVSSEEARFQDTALLLDDVSTAILAPVDDYSPGISYADSDFSYLRTALGEDGNF